MVVHAYNPRTGWRIPVSPALRHQGSRPTLGCSKFQVSFDNLVRSCLRNKNLKSSECLVHSLVFNTHTHTSTHTCCFNEGEIGDSKYCEFQDNRRAGVSNVRSRAVRVTE